MNPNILPDQAYLRECFRYNRKTGVLTWRKRPQAHFPGNGVYSGARVRDAWNAKRNGKEAGTLLRCASGIIYRSVLLDRKARLSHRIIWKMLSGYDPDQIDHRDGDGLNNSWDNLREANKFQNTQNTVGYSEKFPKGVSVNSKGFAAAIRANGQGFYLGTFKTVEEASKAYEDAALRLHKEFANFGHR